MEIWKDIEGYEGLYQVSNMGRVKSLNYNRTGKERLMKLSLKSTGYLIVKLCKEGKEKKYLIHRLVAIAFLDNPQGLPEVNHKDEDKTNNNADNLEWCNGEYNSNYGTRNQRVAEKLSKPVMGINVINGYIVKFPSTREAERVTGFNSSSISKCCNGKQKTCRDYHFKYVQE
ncbi:NUMOD4 domain-containing protein [Clostridium perfringens]|uniref:NUMOD4 domain-containing protein n=1 Tax=Clostridium perfringens TaxID=1502 RepID=UPI0018E45219|nr:NUMOD4 domain-containing protein [Clostridium perfringens]MBI6042188.1 HNH endonuclease [Clostridium perfringens]